MWSLGFRVEDLAFGVWSLGCGVKRNRVRVIGVGFTACLRQYESPMASTTTSRKCEEVPSRARIQGS